MKSKNLRPDAATGKPAMNKLGSRYLYGCEIDTYASNATNIGEMLEEMCERCIDIVKKGETAPYVYFGFVLNGFDFGVGLALHTTDGMLASIHLRSTLKLDLSGIRNEWGEYVNYYLKKRGLVSNKSFAKKVKKYEVSPIDAFILTSAFFKEKVGEEFVE